MGICLDTERGSVLDQEPHMNGHLPKPQRIETITGGYSSASLRSEPLQLSSPKLNHVDIQQILNKYTTVTFFIPSCPVIFIMGGPGSGKLHYSEQITKHFRGYVHINMTETLLQLLRDTGCGMNHLDLSSEVVVGAVMMEMKLSPEAKGYIITGFPRNMQDFTYYAQKVSRMDGCILVDWGEDGLIKQIEYSARLGEVDEELAKQELNQFINNVVPVAKHLKDQQLLHVVDGERDPADAFIDVVKVMGNILSEAPTNGSVVTVQPAEDITTVDESQVKIQANNVAVTKPNIQVHRGDDHFAPVICVMGGPGSCKSRRLTDLSSLYPEWAHISLSKVFRLISQRQTKAPYITEDQTSTVHESVKKGDLVPRELVMQILHHTMAGHSDVHGYLIDGFPRDMIQVQQFESKFGYMPPVILIDCSELELGKQLGKRTGRLDDTLSASTQRLQQYREISLPTLKSLDEKGHLKVIDGDRGHAAIMEDLKEALGKEMEKVKEQIRIKQEKLQTVKEVDIENIHNNSNDKNVHNTNGCDDDFTIEEKSKRNPIRANHIPVPVNTVSKLHNSTENNTELHNNPGHETKDNPMSTQNHVDTPITKTDSIEKLINDEINEVSPAARRKSIQKEHTNQESEEEFDGSNTNKTQNIVVNEETHHEAREETPITTEDTTTDNKSHDDHDQDKQEEIGSRNDDLAKNEENIIENDDSADVVDNGQLNKDSDAVAEENPNTVAEKSNDKIDNKDRDLINNKTTDDKIKVEQNQNNDTGPAVDDDSAKENEPNVENISDANVKPEENEIKENPINSEPETETGKSEDINNSRENSAEAESDKKEENPGEILDNKSDTDSSKEFAIERSNDIDNESSNDPNSEIENDVAEDDNEASFPPPPEQIDTSEENVNVNNPITPEELPPDPNSLVIQDDIPTHLNSLVDAT